MAGRQDARYPPRPIIAITGANGGVGYGIALRLIQQLSSPSQTDLLATSPRSPRSSSDAVSPFATPNGLTLVLLCRNMRKAEAARKRLYESVGLPPEGPKKLEKGGKEEEGSSDEEEEVTRQLLPHNTTSYRAQFLSNLSILLLPIDLASSSSVLSCADQLSSHPEIPYLSHLLLNAGGGPFVSLNWPLAVFGILTRWVKSTTYPNYINEERGRKSADGLGWTWQTNLFSHYLLAHALLPLLHSSPLSSPSRVVWTGSLEGLPQNCDAEDWQSLDEGKYGALGKGIGSYHSVKYQMNLAAWGFNDVIREYEAKEGKGSEGGQRVYSYVCQPGIVAGLMFLELIGRFLDFFMQLSFYISRTLFNSPNHVISPLKSAVAFTFVCLSPLPTLLALSFSFGSGVSDGGYVGENGTPVKGRDEEGGEGRVRFASCTDRWGREYVAIESFDPPTPSSASSLPSSKTLLNADGDEQEEVHLLRNRKRMSKPASPTKTTVSEEGEQVDVEERWWTGFDQYGHKIESGRSREEKVKRLMEYLEKVREEIVEVHGPKGRKARS